MAAVRGRTPWRAEAVLLQLHPEVLRGDHGGFVGRDWPCPHAACCTWIPGATVSRLHLQWLRLDRLAPDESGVLLGYRRGSIAVRDLTGGPSADPDSPGARAWRIVRPGEVLKIGGSQRTYVWTARTAERGPAFGQPTTAHMDVPTSVFLRVFWDGEKARVAVSDLVGGRARPKVLPERQAEVAYWLALRALRHARGEVDTPLLSAEFLRLELFEDWDADAGKKLSRAIERLAKNLRSALGVARPIAVGAGAYGLDRAVATGCVIYDPESGFEDEEARTVFDH